MISPAFETAVGHGLVEEVSRQITPYVAYVAPEPYALLEHRLARKPDHVVVAAQVDQHSLDLHAARAAGVTAVVGIGGGSAIDTAKYVAWKTGALLWQFPTIASVDAVFTRPAGVRVDGRVRYLGEAVPELVVFDLDVVLSAPPALNRAGAGDILSCHTGLHDWRRAVAAGADVPTLDPVLVERAEGWLAAVEENAPDVAAANEEGVRFLISTLRDVGSSCEAAGFSYFEEGSEHYLAYCLEHLTGLRLVHGELVALGIVAMSIAQRNEPERIAALIERLGIPYRPAELGVDRETFRAVLQALPKFCAEEGFPPSAAVALGEGEISEILRFLAQ